MTLPPEVEAGEIYMLPADLQCLFPELLMCRALPQTLSFGELILSISIAVEARADAVHDLVFTFHN